MHVAKASLEISRLSRMAVALSIEWLVKVEVNLDLQRNLTAPTRDNGYRTTLFLLAARYC